MSDIIIKKFYAMCSFPDSTGRCKVLALGPRAFELKSNKPKIGDIVEYVGIFCPSIFKVDGVRAIVGLDVDFRMVES